MESDRVGDRFAKVRFDPLISPLFVRVIEVLIVRLGHGLMVDDVSKIMQ